ncbi:MAG TPA: CDP-glycerol glycerophosphotransferase family protein [Ohtaekwangia sp.]|nr:CDP-glycerol glycerophosphotransferase family protein [Ohtaekwangia sp.]
MRAILFCVNPYAFGILKPLHDELLRQGHQTLWYIPTQLLTHFPFSVHITSSIEELCSYKSDAVFVPGNEVPHYLRGVKVQVFHGLAGEKKGHFRIRNYFDLYLTQGPYFTERFQQLKEKHKDFEVTETGWCKLDPLFQQQDQFREERNKILRDNKKSTLLLYAPTFSPSLSSANSAMCSIFSIADKEDVFLLLKFHDLMDTKLVNDYKEAARLRSNVKVIEDRNILKTLVMADLMISDTSSVVYEFMLLNKPVITINSRSKNINWCDIASPRDLQQTVVSEIAKDNFRATRLETIRLYHPYSDGQSSSRMIAAVEDYISRHGVPNARKINIYRKYLMNKRFGPNPPGDSSQS